MTLFDAVGLAGSAVILGTYALTIGGRLDARSGWALAGNFVGASLILASLWHDFNLSAVIVEAAWAAIALVGLIRLALRR
ncbi:hypothetical protein SAMN05192583_1505 [Sphingomonas gellani]|uniref:CBU-0592-like domain-containing protein n=1 Tax=Sphingomonas gellani TaxID=1166340 RepID=A0A1H8C9D7_9SPHN|nr:hypothetical protein [Sphingomonas gellani]SEM91509.1 hypothetical protein SAMN05192583_1505 [Sphingomonas gellani]